MSDTVLEFLAGAMRSAHARARIEAIQELTRLWAAQRGVDGQADSTLPSTELNAIGRKRDPTKEIDAARIQILSDVAAELKVLRKDIRTRANRSFALLIFYASLSGAAVLTASGLAIAGVIPAAAMSGIGGFLSGGTAVAFWRIYSTETRRADDLIEDLHTIEIARVSYLLTSDLSVEDRGVFTVERLTRRPKDKSS